MAANLLSKNDLAVATDAIPISQLKAGREFIDGFVVADTEMFGLCGKAEFFARSEQFRTILIEGETGTGKELIARLIYKRSIRVKHGRELMVFNCANVYNSVVDSDLFGHKRGSFTGAERDRTGILEAADHGFVFLDEISRLSIRKQAKLLRFLENGTVRPIGTNEERPIDVRLIIATNQNLEALLEKKKFLPDLYYRISKIRCRVPPLAERPSEIEPLIKYFVEKLAPDNSELHIERSSLEYLQCYSWPGNVRELENIMERAVFRRLYKRENVIRTLADDFTAESQAERSESARPLTMKEAQTRAITAALRAARGNKSRASEILGMFRPSFYSWLDKLGINAADYKD